MIRTNELKGIIASKGLSQRKVAQSIGISEKTFYGKMQKGVFDNTEIEAIIEVLNIQNPMEIFFAKEVT